MSATLSIHPITAAFGKFGIAATWTPAGGSATAITVRNVRSPETSDFGQARIQRETRTLRALASEVAPNGIGGSGSIAAGDALTVDGASLIVQGMPVIDDRNGLTVRIDARPE